MRARTLGNELIQVDSSGVKDGNPRSASKKRGRVSKDSPRVGWQEGEGEAGVESMNLQFLLAKLCSYCLFVFFFPVKEFKWKSTKNK